MNKYVPFTQQRYCCVPTCITMVMYRHDIPLIPIEELVYALGLTVPQEDTWLFDRVRTGERPSAGWGTRIQESEFEINKVLYSLGIPLRVNVDSSVRSVDELRVKLRTVQDGDGDALVCFDYGKLWGEDVQGGGQVCVFNKLDGDDVWIIDPERNVPKNRTVSLKKLHDSMVFHDAKNNSGIWSIYNI